MAVKVESVEVLITDALVEMNGQVANAKATVSPYITPETTEVILSISFGNALIVTLKLDPLDAEQLALRLNNPQLIDTRKWER